VCPLLGLLERENAAVLNACLRPLAASLLPQCRAAVCRALGSREPPPPLFLTSNDGKRHLLCVGRTRRLGGGLRRLAAFQGTLLSLPAAAALPLATFQSGPVNSIRGAAWLCHHQRRTMATDVVVVDVGG
jgi:N-methylhydantoinase A/oxoprolinase/acetone carboxylase beta subunit